jgi:hypothetical protein
MRTLPLRLAPIDGESLPGYVVRYAHAHHLQPADVLNALGLHDGTGIITKSGPYGVWLQAAQLHGVSRATGIPADRVQAMLLAVFAGHAFPRSSLSGPRPLTRETQSNEVRTWCSRFCPHCLSEHGTWMLRWQLAWSFACARHKVLLASCCPRCGSVPRIGKRARWAGSYPDPNGHDGSSDPCLCAARPGRELCAAPLASITPTSIDPPATIAQARIDALLAGGYPPLLAGEQLDAPVYLQNLRALGQILRSHAQPTTAPASAGVRLLNDPAVAARFLTAALELADLPDDRALADALRELADRRYRESGQTRASYIPAGISGALQRAVRQASSEAMFARVSRRMGFDPGVYRRPDDLDPSLQACHVPQLFWAEDYEQHLEPLFDCDDFSPRHGRRFSSIMLARLLAPLSWRAAVRYLDLPDRRIETYNTTLSTLRQSGRFDELHGTLKRLANKHAEHPLIDYKQRRTSLADWTGIDQRTWQLLQPHRRPQPHRGDAPTRRAHASIWLWCKLTSGHEYAAPIPFPDRGFHDHTLFVERFIERLHARLLLLGKLLLTTPSHAHQTIPTRLAAALHANGQLAGDVDLDTIDPLIEHQILAHVSAHTGVDTPTLTAPSRAPTHAPPAVRHARLLTVALLRSTAIASWNAIATSMRYSASALANDHRAYQTALAGSPTLARELEQLTHATEDWQTPPPATPSEPHDTRMRAIAQAIQAHAATLLAHQAEMAPRASMLACRAHTDLNWRELAAIHHLPLAQPASLHTIVAYHRRTDPDFDHRYEQLLERGQALQNAAGYANANLTRGPARSPAGQPVPN